MITPSKKKQVVAYFQNLQSQICEAFESVEAAASNSPIFQTLKGERHFKSKRWERTDSVTGQSGGGGLIRYMNGKVFEKVGVMLSETEGYFPEEFRSKIPGAEKDGKFWASGVSLVAHTRSPLMPSAHMNVRMIVTSGKSWFAGGGDLNPMITNHPSHKTDTALFLKAFEEACERHKVADYRKLKQWADEYFYIKHRGRTRGTGGIFYDNLWNEDERSFEENFAFTRDIGESFKDSFSALLLPYIDQAWSDEQREEQLIRRGHYAEFNLIYDRGIQFGLNTNGNIEAMFMSMPPLAKWA